MPGLVECGHQVFRQVQSEERNAGFNRVFVDGAWIDVGRRGYEQDNGGGLQPSSEGRELVFAFAILEPLKWPTVSEDKAGKQASKQASNKGGSPGVRENS